MSKYVRWQVLLTLLGIILVASLLFYVSLEEKTVEPTPTPTLTPSSATTVVKMRGGTYIEGVAGYPQLINPLFSPFNDVDRDLCALVFEGLTTVNARNEVVPLLAERWQELNRLRPKHPIRGSHNSSKTLPILRFIGKRRRRRFGRTRTVRSICWFREWAREER